MRTLCPYCGVGCGLIAEVSDGRLERVEGDPLHPVNRGATCRKPLHLPEAVAAPDRATSVLRRDSLGKRFEPSTWRAAVPALARRLRDIRDERGADAIAVYVSGQLLTEDYYVANKLVKGYLGTNNLDSNSRLCMSSAVAGYQGAFGADGPPPAYADIDRADCLLLLGTNTAACHPIVWTKVRRRAQEGADLIVVDPRRTETAASADLHLPVRPGSDLPLLNAMLHVMAREGLIDERFIASRTEGFEQALATADEWPPERAADACGLPAEQIVEAARRFGHAKRAMVLWSMGANQSTVGTLKNRAMINLCLATGNLGRPGAGPLSLTGQPNAMGGRETGGLASSLPGYRSVAQAEHRAEMRRLWGIPADAPGISPTPGLAATELVDALERGRVAAVWIVATNPVASQPDSERFAAALRQADLVVVQDAYHPTETSALAHVVLPAAQWPEKEGVMTSSERRMGLVRKAIDPPGDALPDWQIFARVGRALGHRDAFAWRTAAEVYAEFAGITSGRPCDQSGVSHERLRREGTLQWPCPSWGPSGEGHDGTVRLYGSGPFPTGGRANFAATPHSDPEDAPDESFPLVLTTGRVPGQWHTMTRTGKSPGLLDADPEPFLELHPCDAERAGVRDGGKAAVRGRRGETRLTVRVTETVPEGTCFAPFHWGALHLEPGQDPVNALTSNALDPVSRQAELKACAVRVEPAGRRERAARRDGRERLLVVGAGMAGQATVEAALAHSPDGFEVTLVGRERELPYDRVLLSRLLAGAIGEPDVLLRPAAWFDEHDVEVLTGTAVERLDIGRRRALLDSGAVREYDKLVLATGSRPALPPIKGLAESGAVAFRSLSDVRRILAAARPGRRAVVIGGGLLGLEAAYGLRARNVRVTVVEAADRLMPAQLDGIGAGLLGRAMRSLGIEAIVSSGVALVTGSGAPESVVMADGSELAADMIVVAAGIRAEVELAKRAGLEVGRGVMVDDELRASAAGVWAVGECAEHRGDVYGLLAPVLAQARVAGASVAARPAAFHGSTSATTLKVSGVDLFCAGSPEAGDGDDEILSLDSRRGIYRRLVLRDGRLRGATLLGDVSDAPRLREALDTGVPPTDDLLAAGGRRDASATGAELVCSCNAVSADEIRHAVAAGADSVVDVARATGATTGCGSCSGDVERMLARLRADRERELGEITAARGA
ncbi:MAG: molybdopterin-dependent oxidoreductase [Thermoleophilaceae bacterium]